MPWNNKYQQNNSEVSYMPPEQKKSIKKLLFIFVIFSLIVGSVFIIFILQKTTTDSDTNKAKEAARKEIPNAEAKQVIVADGYAMAIVYVPKDNSQLGAGNTTIFKVNEDGSMTYIASASYFSPIDLLGFGIPLGTQAKLRKTDENSVRQELADSCNYGYYGLSTPGFSGFDNSFNPDGWQIDSASLNGIVKAIDKATKSKNPNTGHDDSIICINTEIEGSNVSVDKKTFASTFTLKPQFITRKGDITNHIFTFTDGPVYSRVYTLDGNKIDVD